MIDRSDQPDPLDDLLQQANWPDMRMAELRLRDSRQRRLYRLLWVGPIAAAAVIALVCLLVFRPSSRKQAEPQPVEIVSAVSQRIASRPATLYESLLAGVPVKRVSAHQSLSQTPKEQLAASLTKLYTGASPEVVASDIQHLPSRAFVWKTLQSECESRPQDTVRIAKVMVAYAQPQEKAQLESVLSRENMNPVIAPKYAAMASNAELIRHRDRLGDALVVGTLLARGDEGLSSLLSLANDGGIQRAVSELNSLPVGEIARIASRGDADCRARAMRLLAAQNDGGVATLATFVTRDIRRREALVALLASNNPQSRSYLTQFQQDPQLAAEIKVLQDQTQIQ